MNVENSSELSRRIGDLKREKNTKISERALERIESLKGEL